MDKYAKFSEAERNIIEALNHGDTPAADLAVPQGTPEFPLGPDPAHNLNINLHHLSLDDQHLDEGHIAPATEFTGFIPAEPESEAQADSYRHMGL